MLKQEFCQAIFLFCSDIASNFSGFIMVRKILEVKEVTRIAEEEVLLSALKKSNAMPPPPDLQ